MRTVKSTENRLDVNSTIIVAPTHMLSHASTCNYPWTTDLSPVVLKTSACHLLILHPPSSARTRTISYKLYPVKLLSSTLSLSSRLT
jgi:hypothetical protein